MSLRADTLKINPNKQKAIPKEVNTILAHIDDAIKAAYDNDASRVAVSLPITFTIPNMSNKNAQRIIYYNILDSLLTRNYEVQIALTPDKTVFNVSWMTEGEEQELSMQNAILAKHMAKSIADMRL